MKIILFIFLCLVFQVKADSANNGTALLPIDDDKELKDLAAYCLTKEESQELVGNALHYYAISERFIHFLLKESTVIIALRELRSELGFSPLGPWKVANLTNPNEDELWDAPTVEAYYNLKEPKSKDRSLNSTMLMEKNTVIGVAFFDKRFPELREMFRRKFRKIRQKKLGDVDHRVVDRCLREYARIEWRIDQLAEKMFCRMRE